MVLDIYEEMFHRNGANFTQWRPRIEHAQILTQQDLERIGKLGGKKFEVPNVFFSQYQVIASVQPTHA